MPWRVNFTINPDAPATTAANTPIAHKSGYDGHLLLASGRRLMSRIRRKRRTRNFTNINNKLFRDERLATGIAELPHQPDGRW